MTMMRVLVSNDDGIHSPALKALVQWLSQRAEVYLLAPASEQSATSQAITMRHPLAFRKIDFPGCQAAYIVNGSPADCVKLGLEVLIDQPVDWVMSGINLGDNIGQYIYYSGTVAAAVEASLHGVPAMAISARKSEQGQIDYNHILPQLTKIWHTLSQISLPEYCFYNINLVKQEQLTTSKIIVAPLNQTELRFEYQAYRTPKDEPVYWLHRSDQNVVDKSDLERVLAGYTTITPIQLASTPQSFCQALQEVFDAES